MRWGWVVTGCVLWLAGAGSTAQVAAATAGAATAGAAEADATSSGTAKVLNVEVGPANNFAPGSPERLVNDSVIEVVGIIAKRDTDYANRLNDMREAVRASLMKVVDMPMVSGLTLSTYRGKFNDAQFKAFVDAFSNLLFSTYIAHLEAYQGEKVTLLKVRELSKDRVLIETRAVSATRDIPIDYSLTLRNGRWVLYDMRVEGVSLVKNYRTQFREILQNQSPDELVRRIEQKVKDNEK